MCMTQQKLTFAIYGSFNLPFTKTFLEQLKNFTW